MWEKGAVITCKKPAKGVTVGRDYIVMRFRMGQTQDFDRVEITNDAGVLRQVYFASIFELVETI